MEKLRALVRKPSPRMAQGLLTHLDPEPIDYDLALQQWQNYCQALQDSGWEVIEVPAAPQYPDSVFIEDTAVVYDDLAIMTSPRYPARQGETVVVEEVLRELGFEIAHLAPPATLEGGDALKFNQHLRLGLSTRTNEAAVAQVKELLAPRGVTVEGLPVTKVLHLKSGVTILPDGTAIGYLPKSDNIDSYDRFQPVPEFLGSQVVLTGGERALMGGRAPQTAELLRGRGLEVTEVDISEFEKMEGCVTCLSIRLRS